jgi:uncharacterized protein YndB with AHSA1/START domain
VTVAWSREKAFRRFTAEIAKWWPMRTHSVGEDRTRDVVFEGRVGGRFYEVDEGGDTHTWGTVLAWDPPSLVRFTFHAGIEPEKAQEVEVRFVDAGTGTRLELTSTGWEKLGPMAKRARKGYDLGWAHILDLWAGRYGARVILMNLLMAVMKLASRLRPRRPRGAVPKRS